MQHNIELLSKQLQPPWPRLDLPHLAVCGRSNVGKSSLINSLLARKKVAGVGKAPGKTKNLQFFLIDQRWVLADLPGYGYAKVTDELKNRWRRALDNYFSQANQPHGALVLLDARHRPTQQDQQLAQYLTAQAIPWLPVLTKADKVSRGKRHRHAIEIAHALGQDTFTPLWFSSLSGEGVVPLRQHIHQIIS